MKQWMRPRRTRARWPVVGSAVALSAMSGCQSYERAPLDLVGHPGRLQARPVEAEPIARFADRLAREGQPAPERFDPADGLSLAEGEVLALFFNADLRLARLDAGVALATYETAGLWEDPTFGFDGAEVLSPSGPFEIGLTLGLTIPVSGRLAVEKDQAGAAYKAERHRVVDAEWSTRARVRNAWAAWTVALERRRLTHEYVEQVERVSAIADKLEAAGELARVEARLLRAEWVRSRAERVRAELDVSLSRGALLGLMGLSPESGVELLPGLAPSMDAPAVDPVVDPERRIIEANTTLAVRRAEYQWAEESLRLEVRKQFPDITIGGGYGSEDNDDRLLLGVSIPIPLLNANRAGIAQARARREAARAAAETTLERLLRDYAMARSLYYAARTRRASFEHELVPMLDEQSAEVQRLAQLGEADTLMLLEALSSRFEAQTQWLDLRLDEAHAVVEMMRLLGPDWPVAPAPIDPPSKHEATANHTPEATTGADVPGGEVHR